MTYYYAPPGFYLATIGRQYHLFTSGTIKPCCWMVSPQSADDMQQVRAVAAWRVCGWCKRKITNKQAAN